MPSSTLSSSPQQAKGIYRCFSIVQPNSLGSWDLFLSLFGSFALLPSPPMIVALQDPPFRRGKLPSFSLYKCFHPPVSKPRVAFYIYSHLLDCVALLAITSSHPYLFTIDIFAPLGFLELQFSRSRITNAYNRRLSTTPFCSISPQELFPNHAFPALVVGDLNLHLPEVDPLC